MGFFDTKWTITMLYKECFNDPMFMKFWAGPIFTQKRSLQASEKWINVDTTVTHYKEVGFRHEVGRWIAIKSIHKISKLHEILIRTYFDSTEKAIAYEKLSKCWKYLNSNPKGTFWNKLDCSNTMVSNFYWFKVYEILSWANILSPEKAISFGKIVANNYTAITRN